MRDPSITWHFFLRSSCGGYSEAVAYEMCSPLLGGGTVENLDRYTRKFLESIRALGQTAARQGA